MANTTTQAGAPAANGPDLEKIPVEQVLSTLGVKPEQGLSAAEVQQRTAKYGPNAIIVKEKTLAEKIRGYFTGSMAYVIEAAALVSALLGHWDDFFIIGSLLLFNAALEFWQDRKASNALAALKAGLAPEATVMRDGQWSTVQASTLVPGDIVKIRLGVIVPADLRLTSGDFASIDQAALTGESLPARKKVGDEAYAGSVVKQGEMEAVVIATGTNTSFGRTAKLVSGAGAVSHAQKAMFQISNFLIVVAVVLALIMVAVKVYHDIVIAKDWNVADALGILQFVLVLMVASIPVAMPAVFSITMALGALALSKEQAIVSKLSAIEEMAGVDILCSDKTGTLTKNQLSLSEPMLFAATDPAGLHPGGGAGVQARRQGRHRYRGDHRAQGPDAAQELDDDQIRGLRPGHQAHASVGYRRQRQVLRRRQGRAASDCRSCPGAGGGGAEGQGSGRQAGRAGRPGIGRGALGR